MFTMNLKEIEKEILSIPELRIRGVLKKRKEPIEEFIQKFMTKWNLERETIYTGNSHTQCEPNKRRSIGDIYRIVKYYYPKTTLQQVKDYMWGSAWDEIPKLRSSICHTIDKRVFYIGQGQQKSCIMDAEEEDEFELTVEQWRDL